MGNACLVQDGCYSVLDNNMTTALCTCAAVHAVQQEARLHVPHSLFDSEEFHPLCCIQLKQQTSLHHGAGSSGFAVCSTLLQCRGGAL